VTAFVTSSRIPAPCALEFILSLCRKALYTRGRMVFRSTVNGPWPLTCSTYVKDEVGTRKCRARITICGEVAPNDVYCAVSTKTAFMVLSLLNSVVETSKEVSSPTPLLSVL